MTDTALQAAYRAIRVRLIGNGVEPWGNRVYLSLGPQGAAYPYVIQFWSGGGALNAVKARDANLVISVKAVSNNDEAAMLAASRIAALLDDSGEYDDVDDYLYGGATWRILTITEEDTIFLPIRGAAPDEDIIWQVGARYRLRMEVR
jgi:hypothetical protein